MRAARRGDHAVPAARRRSARAAQSADGRGRGARGAAAFGALPALSLVLAGVDRGVATRCARWRPKPGRLTRSSVSDRSTSDVLHACIVARRRSSIRRATKASAAGARSDGQRHAGDRRRARRRFRRCRATRRSCSIPMTTGLDGGDRSAWPPTRSCAASCGTRGLARAAAFTWARTARATLDAYRRVSPSREAAKAEGRTTRVTVPDVSIVIVTWNGRQYLDACLGAVAAQQGVSLETILVDNGSTDGTAAYVRERFPWVRSSRCPRIAALPAATTPVSREARGRFVALLNNDTCRIRLAAALLAGLDEPAGFALTTSRIVYMHDPQVIDSAGDGLLRGAARSSGITACRRPTAAEVTEVFGVCGAACLMPKAVFEELGGFDEDFFASHEDVDLSYRARLRGYRCRYVADAVVRHHGSATLGRHERVCASSTASATSSGCTSRTRRPRCCCERCRAPGLHRGRCALRARWSVGDVPPREGGGGCGGCPRCCASGRGAAHAARRRRRDLAACSSRAGSAQGAREAVRSTPDWHGERRTNDADGCRRPRQLQRRGRAARWRCSRSPRGGRRPGKRWSSTTRRPMAARRSPLEFARRSACCATRERRLRRGVNQGVAASTRAARPDHESRLPAEPGALRR